MKISDINSIYIDICDIYKFFLTQLDISIAGIKKKLNEL
jgi:hypothetical protein